MKKDPASKQVGVHSGAKPSRKKPVRSLPQDVELVEDAWPRFERFIKGVAGTERLGKIAKAKPASLEPCDKK